LNRDFLILGIAETDDPAEIKKAYRRRVKELHPDTAETGEILKNHFLFAEVCEAYRRLTAGSRGGAVRGPAAAGSGAPPRREDAARRGHPDPGGAVRGPAGARGDAAGSGANAMRPHADPAWAYYRKASEYFSRIHPSAWNAERSILVDAKLAHDAEAQRQTAERVRGLVKLFPKAYLYFSTVANEYPDSPWAEDARDKMRVIEKRIARYRNIIESFTEWGAYPERSKEDFEGRMREAKKRYGEFPEESREKWRE